MIFSRRSKLDILLGALCILGAVEACSEYLFRPDAMTDAFMKSIPRTCITVPLEDGYVTTVTERCYYTYVPESANCPAGKTKVPLVVDVHGRGSCPVFHAGYSGWIQKAEEECFVVVFPSGNIVYQDSPYTDSCWSGKGGLTWNDVTTTGCCCEDAMENDVQVSNDSLVLKMVIEDVLATFESSFLKLDPKRVYMTGHSNGCIASLATAATYPESMAAVCCHAGFLGIPPAETYSDNPVPTWLAHGMEDQEIIYTGFSVPIPGLGQIGYWSVPEMMDYLEEQNSCRGERTSVPLFDGMGAEVGFTETSSKCKKQSTVELVSLYDAGHFPMYIPDSNLQALYLQMMDGDRTTVDTTSLAWDFCKEQKQRTGPKSMKSGSKSMKSMTMKSKKSGKSRL